MATAITFNLLSPKGEEEENSTNQILPEIQLQPKTLKPFPPSILNSIERHRKALPYSQSNSDFLTVTQSSLDTDDSDSQKTEGDRKQRSPSEVRISLFPGTGVKRLNSLSKSEVEVSDRMSSMRGSDPSIIESATKPRFDNLRKSLLDKKLSRRIHSSFGSSSTLRSMVFRRRSSNVSSNRRHHIKTDSKWHTVRKKLPDIASMSETYIRVKNKNADWNWARLKQPLFLQVQELREMSQMQEIDDENKEKSPKTGFKLKNIMEDEVIHIDIDGVIHTISTLDLITGRLKQDVHIDKIVHTLVRGHLKRVKKREEHQRVIQQMRLRDLFRTGEKKPDKNLVVSSVSFQDPSVFVHAAYERDNETLQKFLLAGFPPDSPDPATKNTALHAAVESQNIKGVQLLLNNGCQTNLTDISLSTPLHVAAYTNSDELVQLLLTHGADCSRTDNTGRNSFHIAAGANGNVRILQLLVASDTDKRAINSQDKQKWTPLMNACASSHQAAVLFLLQNGADPTIRNDKGMTCLHIATFVGAIDIVNDLCTFPISFTSSPSVTKRQLDKNNNDGPLSSPGIKAFIKPTNRYDTHSVRTVSTSSSDSGKHFIFYDGGSSTIDNQQLIDIADKNNQTALFYAVTEGHTSIAIHLLDLGANPYHFDIDNQTCLHNMLSSTIILKRHLQLFFKLIQYVDYRSLKDRLGRTLLDLAYINEYQSLIYLLTLLGYTRNDEIVFNTDHTNDQTSLNSQTLKSTMFSLKQLCILKWKKSIVHDNTNDHIQTPYDLLIKSFHQCFNINSISPVEKSIDTIEHQQSLVTHYSSLSGTSLSDSINNITSTSKSSTNKRNMISNTKKSALSTNETRSISQTDIQPQQSSNSTFTNRFKQNNNKKSIVEQEITESHQHDMKNLVLNILSSVSKLDSIINYPNLNSNSRLIHEDLQHSIYSYKLG
ncbi:unnamed protein product [Didymodactylos carnosus]|uniref:Uncharacterized protein n=1 Tax=Didymodactylos carnosus TaxID=1234261 RepID=A0A814VZ08_9BILA|nr:unnamed protein product [Didymodactylos carnosus]CAF1195372.1 unnamed protein product [Didymodactylos carnosus]CAF3626530.1 unnamed protein product [Didymodactylos carnosus]CAF3959811.1 unnamed protein product [Didymodactylos carnosus]